MLVSAIKTGKTTFSSFYLIEKGENYKELIAFDVKLIFNLWQLDITFKRFERPESKLNLRPTESEN